MGTERREEDKKATRNVSRRHYRVIIVDNLLPFDFKSMSQSEARDDGGVKTLTPGPRFSLLDFDSDSFSLFLAVLKQTVFRRSSLFTLEAAFFVRRLVQRAKKEELLPFGKQFRTLYTRLQSNKFL
jgi:hypothetical protein